MKKMLPLMFASILLTSCSIFNSKNDPIENNETKPNLQTEDESFIPSDFNNDYNLKEPIVYSTNFENNLNATCRVKASYIETNGIVVEDKRSEQSSGIIYKHINDEYYVVTSASRLAYKSIIKGQVDFNFTGVFEFKFNDGRKYRGDYVGHYKDFDIGVFKIKTTDFLPVGVFGKSDDLKIGQKVSAIGTPNAGQNLLNTYVEGVVSGLYRKATSYYLDKVISVYSSFQFDAPTNEGMQGGAILNEKDEIVGIITNKQVNNNLYESLSFGVAIDDVTNVIDQIIKNGKFEKLLLGFSGGSIDFLNKVPWASDRGIYSGIYVVDVDPNNKAGKAGLKGNSVITSIITNEGTININSMEEFQSQLIRLKIGDSITLCVHSENSQTIQKIKINL